MKKIFWIGLIGLVFNLNSSIAQGWSYSDYNTYTYQNFRENKLFHETIDFDNIDYPRMHAAIFYLTNVERVKKGLMPVEFNLNLEIAAWHHSKAMVKKDFFNHLNIYEKERREPNGRAKFAGINNPYLAENIAETSALQYKSGSELYIIDKENARFSYTDGGPIIPPQTYIGFAEVVVDQWMHSKPHKKNILSKDALQLGCGSYLYYDKRFYNMPTIRSTQNFQWYEKVSASKPIDSLPQD